MKRLSLDTLDTLATQERRPVQRRRTSVNAKTEKALRKYRGHDRSVDIGGVIAPPTKNAAKSAFAAQKPRLNTATPVASRGHVVRVAGIYG